MATPTYKGRGQPAGGSGLFGDFGARLFGVTTPSYAGPGQPSASSSGYLGGTAPAYKPAPAPTSNPVSTGATTGTTPASNAPSATATSGAPDGAASDAAPTVGDPCAMGPGPIAIVIPREMRELIEQP